MNGHSTAASLEGAVRTEGQLHQEYIDITIVLLEFKYGTEDGHSYSVEQSGSTVLQLERHSGSSDKQLSGRLKSENLVMYPKAESWLPDSCVTAKGGFPGFSICLYGLQAPLCPCSAHPFLDGG